MQLSEDDWPEEPCRVERVRSHEAPATVDPAKVGMIGFSPGAFLVVDIAVDPRAAPLAFVAAIYGGETLGLPIPEDAPPLFTCIAQDDVLLYRVVEGLYSDWTDDGRSAELHISGAATTASAWPSRECRQTAGSINSATGSPICHSCSR